MNRIINFNFLFISIFLILNSSFAFAQCDCEFGYYVSGVSQNGGQSYEISIDIEANGNFGIQFNKGRTFLYDVCSSCHPDDAPHPDPLTVLVANGTYLLSITNFDNGCVETITINFPANVGIPHYMEVISGSDECEQGCIAHACDLWLKLNSKGTRINIYAYPHQDIMHQIRYKKAGFWPFGWTYLDWTDEHHDKIDPVLPCTTYLVQIREDCGDGSFSFWSGSKTITTPGCKPIIDLGVQLTPKMGNSENNLAKISVYPNPSNGQFYLNLPIDKHMQNGKIEIFDLLGKSVYTKSYSQTNAKAPIILSNPQLSSGMYLLKFSAANYQASTYFILEN